MSEREAVSVRHLKAKPGHRRRDCEAMMRIEITIVALALLLATTKGHLRCPRP
jgi:hypothetical protein